MDEQTSGERKRFPSELKTVTGNVRFDKKLLASAAMLLFEEGYLPKNKSRIVNVAFKLLLEKAGKEQLSEQEAEDLLKKWEI